MSRIVQELLEAGAARPEQVLLRHAAALEHERARVGRVPAHLAVRLALLVARRPVRHDQVGDLVLARARRDADDARDVGARVGDELLGAVDHPLAAVQPRPRAHVAGVRARLRLGQPERAQLAPGRQLGQPLGLLLGAAEQVDRLRAERRVRAHRDRDGGVHARELLDGDRVGERVAAGAADLLGERDPHQPELAELRDDLVRERLRAVELLRDRRDLALGEVADGAADQLVVGREVEVHPAIKALARGRARPAAARPSPTRPCARTAARGRRRRRRCRGAPTARRPRSGAGTRRP